MIGEGNNKNSQFDVIFFPGLSGAVSGKFLRAQYNGVLRGPGNGVTINLIDLPVNAGFNPATPAPIGGLPNGAAIGDLNNDANHRLDLALAVPGSGTNAGNVVILYNDGAGNFNSSVQIPAGINPTAVAIADIDGDGRNDLIIANAGSVVGGGHNSPDNRYW